MTIETTSDGAASPVLTDDAAFTAGSSSVSVIGALADMTAPDSVDEGDTGAVRMSLARELLVQVRDAAGNERGLNVDASGNITVNAASDTADDSAFTAGTSSITVMGGFADMTAPDSVDEGDAGALRMSLARELLVQVRDAAGNERGLNVDANGAVAVTNAAVQVDDAAFTPATSSVMVVGFEADEASTDSVDEGDAGAARMTLDRKVIVTPQPHTTGGLTIFRSLDLDESEEEVKATAGQVYGCWFSNTATSTRFLKFYNATAATVVVGTTTPVITIALPGNSSDDVSGSLNAGGMGIAFDTAITVAATTAAADADTGAPGASEVIVNVFYK